MANTPSPLPNIVRIVMHIDVYGPSLKNNTMLQCVVERLYINNESAFLWGGSRGGPRCPDPPPPSFIFEKCPFYLGFFGFLQIYLVFFIMLWCPFYLGNPPPPPDHQKSWIRPRFLFTIDISITVLCN